MIYALGFGSDSTFAYFGQVAAARGVEVTEVDLHEVVARGGWRLAIPDDGRSWLSTGTHRHHVDPAGAYFCRVIDLETDDDGPGLAPRWRGLVTSLVAWLAHVPGRVVNHPDAQADNGSKALHEAILARAGFAVPESLSSSDGARLRAFAAAGPTIVKSLSGVRVTCRLVGPDEFDGFAPERGPVHLQRYVTGVDVRAHVVGGRVHAQRIVAPGVDYRDAPPGEVRIDRWEAPPALADRMVEHGRACGLSFAGWDFRVAPDGTPWCLEVNHMPGYDWYDRRLGGELSASLLALLQTPEPGADPVHM